jgi:hypothetical protein
VGPDQVWGYTVLDPTGVPIDGLNGRIGGPIWSEPRGFLHAGEYYTGNGGPAYYMIEGEGPKDDAGSGFQIGSDRGVAGFAVAARPEGGGGALVFGIAVPSQNGPWTIHRAWQPFDALGQPGAAVDLGQLQGVGSAPATFAIGIDLEGSSLLLGVDDGGLEGLWIGPDGGSRGPWFSLASASPLPEPHLLPLARGGFAVRDGQVTRALIDDGATTTSSPPAWLTDQDGVELELLPGRGYAARDLPTRQPDGAHLTLLNEDGQRCSTLRIAGQPGFPWTPSQPHVFEIGADGSIASTANAFNADGGRECLVRVWRNLLR